jgi:hypothetical protein
MEFYRLDNETKERINKILLETALKFGSKNNFLQLIETMRREKENPLLNKSNVYHHTNCKINWQKTIHKESLSALFYAVKKEEKDGNILQNLAPKDFKTTLNMTKALNSVEFVITPKNDTVSAFSFPLFDEVGDKDPKIGIIFKAFFFYPIEYLKKGLAYEVKPPLASSDNTILDGDKS